MNIDQSPIDYYLRIHSFTNQTTEQLLISCNIAYLSTEWLTSVNPFLGAAFVTIATIVSIAVAPTIATWMNKYRQNTLAPIATKALNFTISCLVTKTICFAFGFNITFRQITRVSTAFLVSMIILRWAIKKFSEHFNLGSVP
jgi:uncharacterized Tic20 family protein